MKKTILLTLCFAALWLTSCAQVARDQIRENINLAGSNYLAYRGPQHSLTPAPKGYEPYYISHYGRHGSRYLIGTSDYDKPYYALLHADSLGKLTSKGKETLEKLRLIREEAMGRDGELTLLGAEQHHQIARRMFERFPEVFKGVTDIDAKSTIVIRCILSMENALQELVALNPKLRIRHDASYHDMYYMNDEKSYYAKRRDTPEAREALKAFNDRHTDYSHLMRVLFNDDAYTGAMTDKALGNSLLKLASNVQSTELRRSLSLWDLFAEEEVYNYWLMNNAFWYMYYGPSRETNSAGPYTQVNLLKNIISTADTCVTKPHPGATLRYAHEVDVMPLVCLLDLNHYGQTIDDLEDLDDRGWNNYDIFPMGCNVQFIFYKPRKGNLRDADILVKVLLNEDEATLPIATDRAPYYHWKDVRAYYLRKINSK
ncbi:MAG: histidine-type phosphatase [Prevotella sp.]|nr:histidine-type phosphatase [Prevotella sp.]